ncbi:cation diffusion facilitator family transporter [Spirulina subsalsa]|uniref:cation diffusion facilitator family transporter n=1 Tax=Spirulina subsalsa TaxID=54311 RepID=UPI0022377611|nr:cation diffusion facilitator family transporter [Spirulina subsalsa]
MKRLTWVLCLVGGFSLVEIGMGWFSHSLALQADAGHLLSDCFALLLALFATWFARTSPHSHNRRVEFAAAFLNGLGLVAIALWIGHEAILHLQSPPLDILSTPMLATASLGFGVNSINILLLHEDSHHDLNLRGAFLHVLADAASSVGVILAAIAVWTLNWFWADTVISFAVAFLILLSAIPLLWESANALRTVNSQKELESSNSHVLEAPHP